MHSTLLLMAEIRLTLRLVVYPIIYEVLYIPGGAGFQPSTVVGGEITPVKPIDFRAFISGPITPVITIGPGPILKVT